MIEKVEHQERLVALIIRQDYHGDAMKFFTAPESSLQLSYISHPQGHEIKAHIHNEIPRTVVQTQEVLFVKKGKVKIDFFSMAMEYLESKTLTPGDIVLMAGQGHGLTMLEPTEMVLVKTGPYLGEKDKERFVPEKK